MGLSKNYVAPPRMTNVMGNAMIKPGMQCLGSLFVEPLFCLQGGTPDKLVYYRVQLYLQFP